MSDSRTTIPLFVAYSVAAGCPDADEPAKPSTARCSTGVGVRSEGFDDVEEPPSTFAGGTNAACDHRAAGSVSGRHDTLFVARCPDGRTFASPGFATAGTNALPQVADVARIACPDGNGGAELLLRSPFRSPAPSVEAMALRR